MVNLQGGGALLKAVHILSVGVFKPQLKKKLNIHPGVSGVQFDFLNVQVLLLVVKKDNMKMKTSWFDTYENEWGEAKL